MNKGSRKWEKAQEGRELENRCWEYLKPLLEELHKRVDRRLVKTLLDLVLVILMHRNRNSGLLLSELGDHLLGGERGAAGVKRIASLLHSKRWRSGVIVQWLWKRGDEKVKELRTQKEEIYVIWDESVLEKSESLQAERLCAVRSSKAARLKRIRPGYFNPPGGRPIFVPGFNWLQLLVIGLKGTPVLTHLCWWITRGKQASNQREVEGKILRKVARIWGRQVIHLWDRGFAGSPWTTLALDHRLRFIVRWNIRYHLIGPDGRKQEGWKIARGKRSWDHRMVWDARRRCKRKTGIPLLFLFICLRMSALSFWWSLVLAMDANLGISSPLNQFTTPNKLGRSSLLMPDVGKLRCPCASPNVKWLLNPLAYSLGKPASNSCSSLPSHTPSCFLFSPTPTSCFACSPLSAIEPESGAETSRLHYIAYALLFPAFGSPSALILSLP